MNTRHVELFDPVSSPDYAQILQDIRTNDPVFWFESEAHSAWVISRYQDVIDLLRDERLIQPTLRPRIAEFTPEQQQLLAPLSNFVEKNLGKTRQRKEELRQATKRFFMPGSVKKLRQRVTEVIELLHDKQDTQLPVDIVSTWSYPMPAIVMGEILGAPREDADKFIEWSNCLMKFFRAYSFETMLEVQQGVVEMMDYCADLIQKRMQQGAGDSDLTDDFASLLQQGYFEIDELSASCATFLMAGHENTNYLIGNIFNNLFNNPDTLEKVKNDFSLIPPMMNEVLRYNGVVPFVTREILEDFSFKEHAFKKGQLVSLSLFSANRDDDFFDNPDVFDINNETARHHLGFGHGEEYCRGAHLGQMEAQVLLEFLFEKYPNIQMVEGGMEAQNQPMLRRYITKFEVMLNS